MKWAVLSRLGRRQRRLLVGVVAKGDNLEVEVGIKNGSKSTLGQIDRGIGLTCSCSLLE